MSEMTYDYEPPDDSGTAQVSEVAGDGFTSVTYEDEDGSRHGTFAVRL